MTSGQAKRTIACLLLYAFIATPAFAERSHGFGGGSGSFSGRPRAVESGGGSADPLLSFLHQYCEPLFQGMQRPAVANPLAPRTAGFGGGATAGSMRAAELEVALGMKSGKPVVAGQFATKCASSVSPVNYERALEITGNRVRNERSLPVRDAWQALATAIQRRMNGGGAQSNDDVF